MIGNNKISTRDILGLILLVLLLVGYSILPKQIQLDPVIEKGRMDKLESAKEIYELSDFETDGCSGNISNSWNTVVSGLSKISKNFEEKYSDSKVPFEDACILHDFAYYLGIGGYEGRLRADNQLRDNIISYGIENADQIMKDTGIRSEEEVMYIYELIAEAIYGGVRIGGSPCSGKSYAWGYGYNNGVCE